MAKKFFPRALSVGLSLAMCASMVAPAFAAMDLKDALKDDGSWKSADDRQDAFETVTDDEGNMSEVEKYFMSEDMELEKTLTVDSGRNVEIDLNGKDLALNADIKVDSETGEVEGVNENTKQGSVIAVTGENTSLTVTDSSEDKSGTISGGYSQPATGAGFGGGIMVDGKGASLDLQGGTVTDNVATNGGGIYLGKGSVAVGKDAVIDSNRATNSGGGVYVNSAAAGLEAQFTLDGGTVSNNTAKGYDANGNLVGSGGGIGAVRYDEAAPENEIDIKEGSKITGNNAWNAGGGISVTNVKVSISGSEISGNSAENKEDSKASQNGGGIFASGKATEVTVTDTTISGNKTPDIGGGIFVQQNATVIVNGEKTDITGNEAYYGGGVGVYNYGKFVMNDGAVSENTAAVGGGVYSYWMTDATVKGEVYGNTGTSHSADLYSNTGAIKLVSINGKKLGDTPITGWMWDGTPRWGADSETNSKFTGDIEDLTGERTIWCLVAAHDKYYTVTYDDGTNTTSLDLEKGSKFPTIDDPTREGYTFVGWSMDLPETVDGEITLVANWEPIPVTEDPIDPVDPVDPEEEVDDTAVPLASGPITRAQFIDYLWRHEGEPASDGVCTFTDVTEDHEFVLALAWAEQNGVAAAYADGTFEPDELVTTDAVREFLGNFAQVFGTNAISVGELTTLSGEAGEAVLNCDEVLAEFFGEEYAPAETDGIEIAA